MVYALFYFIVYGSLNVEQDRPVLCRVSSIVCLKKVP